MIIPPLIRRPGDKPGDPVLRYLAQQRRQQRIVLGIQLVCLAVSIIYYLLHNSG